MEIMPLFLSTPTVLEAQPDHHLYQDGSLLAMVLQRASLVRGSHLSYARDATFLTPTASSERLQGYPDSKRHQHQSLGMIKSSPEARRLEDTYSRSRGQSEPSLEPDSSHITLSPT